ncbi:MAG TPA: hypothetical protein VJ743_00890 [Albitalea sp.]|nr:hypothetical protein [Albitalea sp.]
MTDRPEHKEIDAAPSTAMPAGARGTRLTREQLAAAERTLAYHLRRLQRNVVAGETETAAATARNEH